MKVLILGGNPAGMSAASRIKRKAPETKVTVLEKTYEVSYGACGLPYYIAGLNDDLDLLRIRKVSEFEAFGIIVHTGCEAIGIDYVRKYVTAIEGDKKRKFEYDRLLIATGTSPKVPLIDGIRLNNIFVLKTIQDAVKIREAIDSHKQVAIIGGGYIGIELAEACVLRNVKSIRIIEAEDRILNTFDSEFGAAAKEELEKRGVFVHTGEFVKEFEGKDGKVNRIITSRGSYDTDIVILSIGITPNTRFAEGIEKLSNGSIVTDVQMRTSQEDVYAAGDCTAVYHRILKKPMMLALGTNANKQGRLAGDSILGKKVCFDRALGTTMLRCVDLELAKTGLSEAEAKEEGIDFKAETVRSRSHARYYPDPAEITVKLVYHSVSHILLGAQIMGRKEAALRIDVFACAIDRRMTTEELGFLDLGYAPMYASVWDVIHIASNASK